MRAFVFTDSALASQAGRFVWLEINTERAENASFLKRYPVPALPSFFVLDPATERVALRWVGGASVQQLLKILDDGAAAVAGTAGAGSVGQAHLADLAFARAESLYAAGQDSAAARYYQKALRLAPPGWPNDSRAVESLMFALDQSGQSERESRVALDALPRLRHTTSAGNLAASGLEAALALPAAHPDRGTLVRELERAAQAVAADRALPLAGDDRSAVYIALLDARKDAGDSTGAHRVAGAWSAFLDDQAARATNPAARVVYDSHRLSAYVELGEPERAIPMLELSQRDFPDDYNPPARLAIAYRAMRRWNDGLAASDRALSLAYGPRTLTMLQVRTDLFLGLADTTSARRTLEDAIRTARSFPPGQRSDRSIAALQKRLDTLQ
jgi:tetratricopeptide (TPR) repeat protein